MLIDNFKKSTQLLKKAKKLIPSAAQTYSKSYKYFCEGAAPAFLDHGKGAYVWDVDGNKYIDFVLGLGAITVGYNDQQINRAISKQLKKGISFSQSTELEIKLAQKLVDIIPCAEMVRFVKNGSDATTAAIRLARAYTKKEVIACCGYHGWQDWYIGTTESDRGVPDAVKNLTKTFEYNDISSLEKIFRENKNKVAAVIMEPVQLEYPFNNFLQKVKSLTHKNEAVLIFDEVVTGFRMGLSGAQGYFKVIPDLAAIGKGMANGASISVVLGKKEIMGLIEKGVFISMTFGGETLSLAAATETIKILEKKSVYDHIWKLGMQWQEGINLLIKKKGLENVVKIVGIPPHTGVSFNKKGNLEALDLLSVYQQVLIENGILSVGVNNFCLSHTKEQINIFIEAVSKALNMVKKALEAGTVNGILKGKKIEPVFIRNK